MNQKTLKACMLVAAIATLSCGKLYSQGSVNHSPLLKWKCENGNSTLNFNPSMMPGDSLVFDSVPYASDYTVIVVSKPLSNEETRLWQLEYGDSSMRSLTTENIRCGASAIRYSDRTEPYPAIFSLQQSAPDSTQPYARMTAAAQLQDVAEIRYYKGRMGIGNLRRVQSELAIRYGITLGPVDYLRSDRTPVWSHEENAQYHHRITAVAKDSLYGLRQLRSRSEMEGSMLTVGVDSIEEGMYLVVGDNDEQMCFIPDSTGERLSRVWAAQATGSLSSASLSFNKSTIPLPNDSVVLLVDDAVYRPSTSVGNVLTFSEIQFMEGTSHFTLCRGRGYWLQSRSKRGATPSPDHIPESSVSVYPNPTSGHFSIELKNCKNADVSIFNALGEMVLSKHIDDTQSPVIEGYLPIGGEYYVTVTTDEGIQTTKLVVKR